VLGTAAALLVGCYLFLTVRLLVTHPTLAHNYSLELVAPTLGVPEADRAWPLYREAMLRLTPEPKVVDPSHESLVGSGENLPMVDVNVQTERPGSKDWDKVERWIDENQGPLELARQGGTRPRYGFFYNDPGNDAWLTKAGFEAKDLDPNKNEMVISFLLPQHQEIRNLARLLEADARRVLPAGDRQAFLSDVAALVGMAEQLRNDLAFLVVDLISYAVFERALVLVDEASSKYPDVLRDEDFGHLAHQIVSYADGGPIVARLAGARADFYDFVQRICSDDGHGGGVLTYEGVEFLKSFRRELGDTGNAEPFATSILAPLAGGIISRREMVELGDALYDRAEAEFQLPLWRGNRDDYEAELQRLAKNPVNHVRYAPLLILMPSLKGCYAASQRVAQERDATFVALALTLFHRQHGAWPERLDELVPNLLPVIPADRFTGEPLRYRVVEGRPVVYSVGPDKVDNGGQMPDLQGDQLRSLYHMAIQRMPSQTGAALAKEDIGWDYVLWPPDSNPSEIPPSTITQ
jgi:hypothetical protein